MKERGFIDDGEESGIEFVVDNCRTWNGSHWVYSAANTNYVCTLSIRMGTTAGKDVSYFP